jgi:hypothetical protein
MSAVAGCAPCGHRRSVAPRQSRLGHGLLAIALAVVLAPGVATAAGRAKPPAEPALSCPPLVTAQYERISAFGPDGSQGSVEGLTPVFFPDVRLRLVSAQLARAHGGETVPSEMLPPDELAYVLGRPMTWTIWDGQPPAPSAVAHIVCEYEGGMMLYRPLGRTVRACKLTTQLPRPDARGRGSKASAQAIAPGTLPQAQRPVATRALFTCR